MSLGLGFRAFFAVLTNRESADRVRTALQRPSSSQDALPAPEKKPVSTTTAAAKMADAPPKRSEALTLLSALQREARLIDLIMEPLDGVDDAAVGAAVREVLRDSQSTLVRMFAIQPLSEVDEGEPIDLPKIPSPAMYRLLGSASQTSRGTVTHRGWRATQCDVPKWTGASGESQVLAPIEVEVG